MHQLTAISFPVAVGQRNRERGFEGSYLGRADLAPLEHSNAQPATAALGLWPIEIPPSEALRDPDGCAFEVHASPGQTQALGNPGPGGHTGFIGLRQERHSTADDVVTSGHDFKLVLLDQARNHG